MTKPSKKLAAIWKEKLKKSGFHDLEIDNKGTLENNSTSGGFLDKRRVTWQSQAEYYQYTTYFLNDYPFNNRIEQIIWEYHSNGMSTRDIANTLNKVRKKKILRMTVWRIVKRLSEKMKEMYDIK